MINKVHRYAKCETYKNLKFSINKFLLRKIIKLIDFYYIIKWDTLIGLEVLPSGFISIAIQDLGSLLNTDKSLRHNEEYKNIFRETYETNEYFLRQYNVESGEPVSKIAEVIKEKIKDIDFLNKINNMDQIIGLFAVLNDIDNQAEDNQYFSQIFNIAFRHIINGNSQDKIWVKYFYEKMNDGYLPEYLLEERNAVTQDILMSGSAITNN